MAAPLCSCKNVEEFYETGFPGFSKKEIEITLASKNRILNNFDLIKLNDDLDIIGMKHHIESNFKIVAQILNDDLNITSVYPYSFEFKRETTFRTSSPEIADFLLDIL